MAEQKNYDTYIYFKYFIRNKFARAVRHLRRAHPESTTHAHGTSYRQLSYNEKTTTGRFVSTHIVMYIFDGGFLFYT